jgi:hypothetical protein
MCGSVVEEKLSKQLNTSINFPPYSRLRLLFSEGGDGGEGKTVTKE